MPFPTVRNEDNGAAILKADYELTTEIEGSIKKILTLPDLDIYYDVESDTLPLWYGSPAGYGEMVAKHLTAESNADGEIVGITQEHAAELLRPYLFPESQNGTAEGANKRAG